jgi:hypothetical protein
MINKVYMLSKILPLRKIVGSCWRYNGTKDDYGRGHITIDSISYIVSRLSAIIFLNLNPDSKDQANHKDNLCKFKDCWNPDHLYVGNQVQNIRDSVESKTQRNSRKTHCPQGHEYTKENTLTWTSPQGHVWRLCRTCNRDSARNRYKSKKRKERERENARNSVHS